MIRPININLNAAHPELPLVEATTFTGAPSSVFIRGVPKSVGNWSITAVYVAVTYPDNSTTTRAAVESAEGVWVATIPGTATSGRTVAGFRILADGIDENGAAVTGYVLGFADFSVFSFLPVPAPGETFYLLRYFDAMPTTPKKGDVAKIGGVLEFYNGTAWEPFAAPVTLDDAVTPTSANGVKSSGIWSALWGALSALPTGFSSLYDWCVAQLAGKASTADATLTERGPNQDGFSAWNVQPVYSAGYTAYVGPVWNDARNAWSITFTGDPSRLDAVEFADSGNTKTSLSVGFPSGTTATRTVLRGYQLGSQEDKPLASEAEAAALRTGKANRVSNPTDGNLAALDADGNPTDSTIPAANVAVKGNIPYTLGTPTVIDTASSETVEGETVYYGAATLADRTANIVGVAVALDELRVTIPPAISGKVRDFGLYVAVGLGEGTALAAPALVPVAPTGETITLMNTEGEMPTLADGTTTESGTTVLYFTEVADGTFLVKGEQIQGVA